MISEDRIEMERIARQAAIDAHLRDSTKQALEEGADSKAKATSEPEQQPRTYYGRKLLPGEAIVNGRVEQVRPLRREEQEAMDEKALMDSIRKNDEANERRMQEAMKEARLEQVAMDKRREREAKTGKRPYNERRFITLEEARRRGYLQSENASNGKPEYWSPDNPEGIFPWLATPIGENTHANQRPGEAKGDPRPVPERISREKQTKNLRKTVFVER